MKKTYEKPLAEKIQFNYSTQVVASDRSDWFAYAGGMANYQDNSCKCYIPIGCSYGIVNN